MFLIVSQPFSPFTPFKTASMFFCLLFPLAFVPHCIPPVFLLVVFSRSKSVLNKQFHLSRRVALLIPTLPTQTGHWWWSLFAANPVDLYLNGSVERVSIPHSLGFSCGTRTGRCQLCDHFMSIISTPGTINLHEINAFDHNKCAQRAWHPSIIRSVHNDGVPWIGTKLLWNRLSRLKTIPNHRVRTVRETPLIRPQTVEYVDAVMPH